MKLYAYRHPGCSYSRFLFEEQEKEFLEKENSERIWYEVEFRRCETKKLKPCPWCKHEYLEYHWQADRCALKCSGCGVCGPFADNEGLAEEAWGYAYGHNEEQEKPEPRKLKPCWHCKSTHEGYEHPMMDNTVSVIRRDDSYYIECKICGVTGPRKVSRELAEESWGYAE